MKSDKIPYIIYPDMKSSIKKMDECENNPENSSAAKIGEHIGYLISPLWAFDNKKTRILYNVRKIAWKSFVLG